MAGDRDLHILFGSQSGNAEGLCALIAKRAADYGFGWTRSRHGWI